jgi:hypothetical protein
VTLLVRTNDRAYDLRQRLNRAVRWLREAEDIARTEMPAWPTADRIRDIYEQVGEDVLNGKKTIPPLRQRLAEAEADRDRYGEALRGLLVHLNEGEWVPKPELDAANAALDAKGS